MAENLILKATLKEEKYKELIPQLTALLSGETDLIANLANTCAVLKTAFNFFWVGFYFVKNEELVLGPFQGPIACTRIQKGKGVCGKSWEDKQTIIVENVDEFPNHIACSSFSKSEIVVPLIKNNEVTAKSDSGSFSLSLFRWCLLNLLFIL